MSEEFYLRSTKLPVRSYNHFEWKDNILYLYYNKEGFEKSDQLSQEDIKSYPPFTENKNLQKLINDIRGENQSTPEKLTPENNELIEIFKDGNGTRLNFDLGTKVYLDRNTIYDKDNMYKIIKKYGPFKTVDVTKSGWGTGTSTVDDIIIYKYDLQNINHENKTIEKAFNVFKAENLELDGVISNDTTIKENINDEIDGKTIKENINDEIDGKTIKENINDEIDGKTDKIDGKTIKKIVKDEGYIFRPDVGYKALYPDRHFITFDDDETTTFTGEVNKIDGNNQKAGKRKTRRNRKSKKGKRSRKARKSRRKSNRRRGRR